MGTLSHDQILRLSEALIRTGLVNRRDALLTDIHGRLRAELRVAQNPSDQVLLDLEELNNVGVLADGTLPLVKLLKNAVAAAGLREDAGVFKEALRCAEQTLGLPLNGNQPSPKQANSAVQEIRRPPRDAREGPERNTVTPRAAATRRRSCPVPPRDLLDAMGEGKVVPFIGAGISRASGLPDHRELLERLQNAAEEEDLPPAQQPNWVVLKERFREGRLDAVVDEIRTKVPRALYWKWFRRELRASAPVPTQHHVMLNLLDFQFFITTNYDRVLEQTLYPIPEVLTHKELDMARLLMREKDRFILKLHGDISRADDILHGTLSQAGYEHDLFNPTNDASLKEVSEFLKHVFESHTVLFLGCSFADNNEYTTFMREVAKTSRNYSRRHYALVPAGERGGSSIVEASKSLNLDFLEYDPSESHKAVWQFLAQLRPGTRFTSIPNRAQGTFFTTNKRPEYLRQQFELEERGRAFRYLTPTLSNALAPEEFLNREAAKTLDNFSGDLDSKIPLEEWKADVLKHMRLRRDLLERKIRSGAEVRLLCEEAELRKQAESCDAITRARFRWVIDLLNEPGVDVEVRITQRPFSERDVRSFALVLMPSDNGVDVAVAYAPQANNNEFAVNIVQQNTEYARSRLVLFEQEWVRAYDEKESLAILEELFPR